ncbi:hypothetical protein N7456_000995 [Penicillium angulare]|uniref:Uncharacterized protein n=1 Tax=Penicillium angulare TaxID=116970 RepID=A0A9W9GDK9_9EURO|nr:hypothetical protein N7456_000995 [Penicillium angulare]
MTTTITGKDLLLEPLPELRTGPNRTASQALHSTKFVGSLRPWSTFKTDVLSTFHHHQFQTLPLYARVTSRRNDIFEEESFGVADEIGVQARFCDRVGQIMSTICKDEGPLSPLVN